MLRVALLLSGAASLVYQVVWTRRLITVTSATAAAQGLVLAVFMAGLGLGAWLAARWCARLRRPALVFALVETSAAVLALASLPVISASDAIRAAALAHVGGAAAGSLQLAVLALYLLAPTTLLGASLPLVIEHEERRATESSRSIAVLYGVNTAGACAGCLLAGFVTIELAGLTRTAACGALLGVAGAIVAAVSGRLTKVTNERPAPVAHAPLEAKSWIAAALAGFASLGAEVVATRLFALIIPNTVYTFTQVLSAVLIGIAAGALAPRFIRASHARVAGLLSAGAAVLLGAVPWIVVRFAGDASLQKTLASGSSLLAALAVFGCLVPVSALLATVLPLLAIEARGAARAFGRLYAVNVAGSVAGSLAAGFVLIPVLGIKAAVIVLQLAALSIALLLSSKRARGPALVLAGAACAGLYFTHDVPQDIYRRKLPAGASILDFHEGVTSHVMVTEDQARERRLWINSFWVAGSAGPHRVFGLLPGLFVDDPKRALGIALGTGQTFAATLRHGGAHFDCVEIDPGVVRLSRRWFDRVNGGLLDDPRVHVHVEDGRTFMRAAPSRYDLIVLEPLQAWTAGTSNLYSREFYVEARAILTPGGVVAQWIPFYGQGLEETRAMVRTALDVFPSASLWLAGRDGVLLLSDAPFALSLETLDRRLVERRLLADIAPLPARTAEDLVLHLLLGPHGLRRWTAGASVLVDDRPVLEFRAARQIGTTEARFSPILESALGARDDLGQYLVGPDVSDARRLTLERLRRATFELELLPADDFRARLDRLESLPADARAMLVWKARYRSAVTSAIAALEERGDHAGVAALRARARAIDPSVVDGAD
ncbi:MAG: fused MFS/spermidine synthase [Labilithrix sp.]|nr:fused MFS/spermidine synthase [Labilithrix sp.]